MNDRFERGRVIGLLAAAPILCAGLLSAAPASNGSFLITNDDTLPPGTGSITPNSATFYLVGPNGGLARKATVQTAGSGIAGGYFAVRRVVIAQSCAFVSDAGSGDITGISIPTQTVTGSFNGSSTDSGSGNGIGMATNGKFLYASFTASGSVATFEVQPGCLLNFVGDTPLSGLNGGTVTGMAISGTRMVTAYGDGSIESFDMSEGLPSSDGDLQNSTGYARDHIPNGVDITSDGHFAIFGDGSTITTVEVSDLSSGKLAPTVAYNLGTGWNSGTPHLSPDNTLLFVANNSSGQVTAVFFDKTTGVPGAGCKSASLKGFYKNFSYVGDIAFQSNTGAGGAIYVPEFGGGGASGIATVNITSSNGSCSLTEAAQSPIADPNSPALFSIAVYRP